jgi:hypothetical protein
MKSLILTTSALSVVHQISAQHAQGHSNRNDSRISTLEWCVPIVVAVLLIFVAISAIIVYTVYRQKKYGAFCCLMPKMRYHISEEVGRETFDRHDYPTPPPSYDVSHRCIIAPPEYQDALQDLLLDSGDSSTRQTVAVWSNAMITASPPEYSATAAAVTVLDTSGSGTETLQREENSNGDTGSPKSLSCTTISMPSLDPVSSGEQITGAMLIPPLPPLLIPTDRETGPSGDSEHTKSSNPH